MERTTEQSRRITTSFTIPGPDFDFLDAVASTRFQYNRSAALMHYYKLGRAAEEEGWRPNAATQAKG